MCIPQKRMFFNKILSRFFASSLIGILLLPFRVYGQALPLTLPVGFDPNAIIPDEYVLSAPQLTARDIETFLVQRKSGLANRSFFTADGFLKASEIIARAAQDHNISAQFLLVKLQKEQSLIENPRPSQKALDWATGFGICDDCSMDDPRLQSFKGFPNQVRLAARQMQRYLQEPERYNFRVGGTYVISGIPVSIQNRITAALYNYTPHIFGNLNLWRLWQRYWFRPFADGQIVKIQESGKDPEFWLIRDGKRRKFSSRGVYESHANGTQARTPVTATRADLEQFPIGPEIKFPEYSLLRSLNSVYLLRNGYRHAIENEEVFRILGFNPEEVEDVNFEDIDMIPLGRMITAQDRFPTGQLVQQSGTQNFFWVEQGFKYPIPNQEIRRARYGQRRAIVLSAATLKNLKTGPAQFFPAGTVVMGNLKRNRTIFLVTEKGVQPFASELDFLQLGFKKEDIIRVNPALIENQTRLPPLAVGSNIPLPEPTHGRDDVSVQNTNPSVPLVAEITQESQNPTSLIGSLSGQ